MAIISIRLSEQEEKIFQEYAKFSGDNLSTLFKKSLVEKIEEEFDLKELKEARAYNKKHIETYTHEEIKKELGL